MRESEGKAAADRGWLAMTQQSTIGTRLHICEEHVERRRRREIWRKRSIFTFRLISGRRPHTQASKTGKIWQDTVSWGEERLQSSDQRINHVGMDQERSNTEKMRGFGAVLP